MWMFNDWKKKLNSTYFNKIICIYCTYVYVVDVLKLKQNKENNIECFLSKTEHG